MMEEEKEPLLKEHVQEGLDPNLSYTKERKSGKEKEKKEPPKNAKFSDLFRYATCWDIFLMIFGSLMAIVHGTGFPLLSLVFGDVTNTFISGPGGANRNVSSNMSLPNMTIADFNEKMTQSALYYIYIGSGVFVATYLQIACWTSACERQIFKIRKKFFHAIMRQEISWFDERQSGELTTRLADDLEKVKDGMGDKFSFVIQFASAFFSGFGVGFWKGWKMTLVMMSLSPLLAICASLMGKIMTEFTKKEQASYAGAGSVAEEVLSCIRTVISFNGQKQETKRYEKALLESRSLGIKKGNFNGFFIGLTYLVMFGTYALAFWYGSELVKDWYGSGFTDGLSPGDVIVIFFCVLIGSFSLGNAAPHLGSIFAAKGAGAVIFDVIDNVPSIDNMSPQGEHPNFINGNIDFVGVNFSYKAGTDEEVKAVKNLNLSVKQGRTVALVGSSGCGKSTIINLLQRFYDPVNGQVYLDGKNIKDLNVGWLRNNIGVVSQEPVLFDCTISENIRLGNPYATEAQIREASMMANAHDFISNLPKKVKKNILQIKIQIKAVNGERKRRKYDDSDLKSAINSVKEKTLSIREASKLYKIPKSTIQDCLAQNRSETKAPGRQNSLNHTQETSLVNYINYMSKRGFPLSLKTMKYYVGAIVQKNNKIRVNFKHPEPSNEWCRKFLKKHNLSLRTPEELSLVHTYVTEKIVSEYFNLLKQTITNLNIEDKPSQIYNMDEIGWGPGNKKRRKVIVQKGVAHPIQQQSLIVDHISALICGNAEGRLIPPSIIFKESLPLKLDDAPENWSYVATNNTFSSKEVFADWMKKCFIPNCGRARPVLLLLDNSITHFSIEAIELAVENQIELMGFPPNCTPLVQPMDQIFQHLRQAVEEVASALRMVNTNSTLSKNNFSLVLKYALPRGLTKSRVSSAFKSCGIFPFNPSAIDRSYIIVLDPIIQMPNYDNSPLPNEQNEENTDELNDDNNDELQSTTLANGGTVENVFGTQNETSIVQTSIFLPDDKVLEKSDGRENELIAEQSTPSSSFSYCGNTTGSGEINVSFIDRETQTDPYNPLVSMGLIDEGVADILRAPSVKTRKKRKKISKAQLLTGAEYRREIEKQQEEQRILQLEKERKRELAAKKREETQRKKEEAKRKREEKKALAEKLREEKSKTKKVKQNKKSCSEKQESEQISSEHPDNDVVQLFPIKTKDNTLEYISLDSVSPLTRQCEVCMIG